MHKIPADEFCVIQGDAPAWITWSFAPCRKSHVLFLNRKDPAVGDRNLMCIPAKILDRIAKSIESFFDIRTPVFLIEMIAKFRPFPGIPEIFIGRGKQQVVFFIKGIQLSEIFSGSIIFFVGLTLPRYRFSKPSASLDMNLR